MNTDNFNPDRREFSVPWSFILGVIACAFWVTVAWPAWAGK